MVTYFSMLRRRSNLITDKVVAFLFTESLTTKFAKIISYARRISVQLKKMVPE